MQIELGLVPMYRWGGRRPAAGRKPGPRPRIPHLRREEFKARQPCHVTLRVRPTVPSLRTVKVVREMERSLREICERETFRVVAYSLQSNHVHLIVEADGPDALARGMKSVGARLARAVNRVFARRGPVLEDRYHARALRTPREVRNALAYVLLNARKHLGERARAVATIDPASSGRWFDGWIGDPDRKARTDPPWRIWLGERVVRRHKILGVGIGSSIPTLLRRSHAISGFDGTPEEALRERSLRGRRQSAQRILVTCVQ